MLFLITRGGDAFFLFSTRENGSLLWYLELAMAIMCRVAVPGFFMISGALFLAKDDEKLSNIFKKYILKIFIIFAVFAFVYYINSLRNSTNSFDIIYFIKAMYSYDYNINYDISGHLWYLYAYIGFLAFLPFLRSMVQNLKTKYFYYMIVLAFVFKGILPVFEYFVFDGNISLSDYFRTSWILTDIFIYPCIGYFLQYRIEIEKVRKKDIILLWLANLICIVISCCLATYRGRIDGTYANQPFFNSFVVVNAITLFITAKYLFNNCKLPNLINKGIISIGRTTFGIYLIHILVRYTKESEKVRLFLVDMLGNNMIAALIWCTIIMLVCYIIIVILKKIPIVKKLVGG